MANTREIMNLEAHKPNGARVGIPARRMEFRFPEQKAAFCFYDDNALASSLFAVFSAIFPPGERFFVDSVRHYRNRIDDETLASEVIGFMGQEAIHGRQHERLNEWFVSHGYDMAMPERTIRFGLDLLRRLPPSQQLACTTFMEHFTAHLAEQLLTDEAFRSGTDPDMIGLWTWHALEELEHKSVAFDVHRMVSEREHLERLVSGPLVIAALLPGIVFSMGWLIAMQGEATRLREHRRGLRVLFGRGGFLREVLPHMPAFFARDFHPSDRATEALVERWRERLFGAEGELNEAFRNREAIAAIMTPG